MSRIKSPSNIQIQSQSHSRPASTLFFRFSANEFAVILIISSSENPMLCIDASNLSKDLSYE